MSSFCPKLSFRANSLSRAWVGQLVGAPDPAKGLLGVLKQGVQGLAVNPALLPNQHQGVVGVGQSLNMLLQTLQQA